MYCISHNARHRCGGLAAILAVLAGGCCPNCNAPPITDLPPAVRSNCGAGSAGPTPSPIPTGPTVEVGTASDLGAGTGFRSLANCDGVSIIHGPQGGSHIWVSLRSKGLDPLGADIAITIRMADSGGIVSNVAPRGNTYHLEPGGALVYDGLRAFLCNPGCSGSKSELSQQVATIHVRVTDRNNLQASDERRVVVL